MICRDTRKDYTYFVKYISDQEKRITRFEDIRANLSAEDKIKECNGMLSNLQRNMFFAKFSAGYSKEDLCTAFNTYIDQLLLAKDALYDELINAIAIDIVLDAGRRKDLCILALDNENDILTDTLLGISGESKQLSYKSNYEPFYKFLTDAISTDDFIRYINDEWYSACKDFYWYDSLKSDNETYVGYWCWLAAAILKVKNFTVENIFIPKV